MTDSCVTDIRKRHDRNIRLAWVLLILALVISGSVAWLLRGVGITLANETTCGLAEHQHSAACYLETAEGSQLICEIPEHVHTVECAGVTRQEQAIPVVEIITPTEADEEPAAEEEIRETDKLPVYLADSSYTKNVIYVVTALGERDKNTVHEYLPDLGIAGANDGQYVLNSAEAPYILQIGDTVELCIYADGSDTNTFWSSPSGALTTVSESYVILEDGTRKGTKTYRTNQVGDAVIHYGDQSFYITVPDPNQTLADFHFDHADIEITDGGYYEVTRTVTDHSGRQVTTRQIFDSYITMVNHCYIYNESKSVIMHYESSDYEAHGTPGETQYELTSKYKCMNKEGKWFKRDQIETAQFDVQLLLKPRTQIVTITNNGTVVSQTETDISDSSGESDITIPSAVFDMNHRSVIDANNKCPDHSGLDFNLMANVNELMNLEPAFVQPKASKQLTDGTIGENQFQFDLLDDSGKLVDRQYCDASGQVTFAEQFFLLPGTYTYTIRETIPSAAVKVDGQTYYNGIFYDTHTETVTAENLSVVSSTNCTASYNSGAFTVQDIQPGALVKVRCDNVADASKLLLHQTFEGTQENWSRIGAAQMGNAYSTNYVATGSTYHALKVYNRTAAWMGAGYTLDPAVFVPGNTYSFSAYLCKSVNYTASDNSTTTSLGSDHAVQLNLTLCYQDGAGETRYLGIATANTTASSSWIQLSNASLTIPLDCVSMRLQIDSSGESGSDMFADLYLDEVIIAPSDTQLSVEQGTGRVLLSNPEYFSFTVTGKTIPVAVQQAAENWQLDSWSKQITISAAEGWIKTLSAAELDEVPNREYQYFVQEDPLSGFTPSYSDMYVSSNTTQNPMIIKNQSIAYTLPATGGVGLAPFLGGGSVLILGSVLFSYQLIRKRRRSSA